MLGAEVMSVDPGVSDQSGEELQQADAERYGKLMRAIAWLDKLRETAIPEVVAAQRSRFIEELLHVDLRRNRIEQRKNLRIRELDHRFKNLLSVISVIASRTQETTSSMAGFVTALDGRIKALTVAHELLSRQNWHGISLVDLVHQELAPYANSSNTEIQGSDDILSADAGQAIGMVLHELATNAAKYGALSNKDGRVRVYWRQQQNEQGENQLRIEWQERDGPLVEPQSQCGYGTVMIREIIPHELGGAVELVHSREGVHCKLEIPAHWIADSNPVKTSLGLTATLGSCHSVS